MKSEETTKTSGFPERLRELRESKKLSQRDLSKISGIHYLSIGKYERGQIEPAANSLRKLAEALEATTDYLLEGTADQQAEDRLSDRELLAQFQIIEEMPEADKSYVKRFLRNTINEFKIKELAAG